MGDIRLAWEPENKVPMDIIEKALKSKFAGKSGGVSILRNGTLFFVGVENDPVSDAKKAIAEAKFLIDFKVAPIGNDGFLVALHGAVAVYVGTQEFENQKDELKARINDLKFPAEESLIPSNWSESEYLIGILGRAKLQRDAYNFNFYNRLEFSDLPRHPC